jgi:fumarylacetoacetase
MIESSLVAKEKYTNTLPVEVGDFWDYGGTRDSAFNVGSLVRDPENALPPNWLSLPIANHARNSSVCISGTPCIRPRG